MGIHRVIHHCQTLCDLVELNAADKIEETLLAKGPRDTWDILVLLTESKYIQKHKRTSSSMIVLISI